MVSEIPDWVQAEQSHIKRVLYATMLALLIVGAATLGMIALKTRWALVPAVGLGLCQFALYYTIVRRVLLAHRIKRAGITIPSPPRRAVIATVCFGLLCLAGGILGVVQQQGPLILWGFLGAACFAYVIFDLWRKDARRRR